MDDFWAKTLPAWVGAILGVWGLARHWMTTRPYIWLAGTASEGAAGRVFIRNNATAPILVLSVAGTLGRDHPVTFNATTRDTVESVIHGVRNRVIEPGEMMELNVGIGPAGDIRLAVHWRTLQGLGWWPIPSFLFVGRRTVERLRAASVRETPKLADFT